MKKIKFIIVCLIMLFSSSILVYADGWINDGRGNWQYEENGELIKATWKNIDGVNYYFDTKGNWLPTGNNAEIKLKGSEMVSFIMEGKDDSERSYKTKITIPRPIVKGNNEDKINSFIQQEFQNAITKYYEETQKNILFLKPEIKIDQVLEAYNVRGIIGLGYIGGAMFNLYIDTNKLEMWATSNRN